MAYSSFLVTFPRFLSEFYEVTAYDFDNLMGVSRLGKDGYLSLLYSKGVSVGCWDMYSNEVTA